MVGSIVAVTVIHGGGSKLGSSRLLVVLVLRFFGGAAALFLGFVWGGELLAKEGQFLRRDMEGLGQDMRLTINEQLYLHCLNILVARIHLVRVITLIHLFLEYFSNNYYFSKWQNLVYNLFKKL